MLLSRRRAVLALIGGVIFILSSAFHSIFGWKALQTQLAPSHVSLDLVQGLEIVWHFADVAMLAFGAIVTITGLRAFRGEAVSTLPLLVIAISFLLFATWGLLITRFDPCLLVFPGSGHFAGFEPTLEDKR